MEFFDNIGVPGVVFGALLGGAVLVLVYILRLFSDAQFEKTKDRSKNEYPSTFQSDRKKELLSAPKTKKKQPFDNRWNARNDRQVYSHPWLLKNLKGHTEQVLDVDFAPNGKYLATCGEGRTESFFLCVDDDDSIVIDTDTATGSDSNKENSRPPSSTPSPKLGLSRRQRKNRRRDISPKARKLDLMAPLKQCQKLNLSERDFHDHLHKYMLTHEQSISMGYPFNDDCGRVCFFNYNNFSRNRTRFDVNAREFVPNYENCSSSGSSSDSGDSEDTEYYTVNKDEKDVPGVERSCVRCGKGFFITNKEYLTQERCCYHWGKLQTIHRGDSHGGIVPRVQYNCCQNESGSVGCSTSKLHVWNGVVSGLNGPLEGFVKTRSKKIAPADGNYGVYAIDCEMSYTVAGLELTRVTVVGMDGRLVYESYVKPISEIIDYNTRFSGITAKHLSKSDTKTLKQVQNDLRGFISDKTVLIGHSLDNDLRALKMIHKAIVDTACSFPHYNGLPYKRSLKSLVSSYLKREIQQREHDSYEDACSCMELMLWRVRKDRV